MGTRPAVFVSTQELVNEVCDEKRFQKSVSSVLRVCTPNLPAVFGPCADIGYPDCA